MSRKKLYCIRLEEGEREELNNYLRRGNSSSRSLTRARILLLADEGRSDEEISDVLKVSKSTASRIRKRYCEGGLDFALHEKSRSGAPTKIDGRIEAQLTLLACSPDPLPPPAGVTEWGLAAEQDDVELLGRLQGSSEQLVGARQSSARWGRSTRSSPTRLRRWCSAGRTPTP